MAACPLRELEHRDLSINSFSFNLWLKRNGANLNRHPDKRGSSGLVYLTKECAIKIFNKASHGRSEWEIADFFQSRSVRHIPEYYYSIQEDTQEGPRRSAIFMQKLPASVYDVLYDLSKAHFQISQIQNIAKNALQALTDIHASGYIHGDLKPENIFLDGYVADFSSSFKIGSEKYLGTPEYLPPELLLGLSITDKADLFALGLTLFEMYTGNPLVYRSRSPKQDLYHLHQIESAIGKIPESMINTNSPHFITNNNGTMLKRIPVEKASKLPRDFTKTLINIAKKRGHLDGEVTPFVNFLKGLLSLDHETRYSAEEALEDPFLKEHLSAETRRWEERQQEIAHQVLNNRILGIAHNSPKATKYHLKKKNGCIIL